MGAAIRVRSKTQTSEPLRFRSPLSPPCRISSTNYSDSFMAAGRSTKVHSGSLAGTSRGTGSTSFTTGGSKAFTRRNALYDPPELPRDQLGQEIRRTSGRLSPHPSMARRHQRDLRGLSPPRTPTSLASHLRVRADLWPDADERRRQARSHPLRRRAARQGRLRRAHPDRRRLVSQHQAGGLDVARL